MCKKGLPAVWTKEKIEEAFAGFVEKNRRLPVAREMKPQYGLPTRRTFERYMDTTAQEYAELRYPPLLSARDERHVQTVLAYCILRNRQISNSSLTLLLPRKIKTGITCA